ncbi:hypothetical protein MIR68_001579 [Amoeboaphelidium protococcarum]|nr:hypothetical protein MIR68_001579 [Amoeboaphelidium protococcarum]
MTSAELINSKLQQQIEFYFSDSNLKRDNFMRIELAKSEQIPLATLLTFKRVQSLLQQYQQESDNVESDAFDQEKQIAVLIEALSKSSDLKVDSDAKTVGRLTPYDLTADPQAMQEKSDAVTMHMTNFPFTASLDDLMNFLNTEVLKFIESSAEGDAKSSYAGVALIKMQHRSTPGNFSAKKTDGESAEGANKQRSFNGQAWVEMKRVEDVKWLTDLSAKKLLQYPVADGSNRTITALDKKSYLEEQAKLKVTTCAKVKLFLPDSLDVDADQELLFKLILSLRKELNSVDSNYVVSLQHVKAEKVDEQSQENQPEQEQQQQEQSEGAPKSNLKKVKFIVKFASNNTKKVVEKFTFFKLSLDTKKAEGESEQQESVVVKGKLYLVPEMEVVNTFVDHNKLVKFQVKQIIDSDGVEVDLSAGNDKIQLPTRHELKDYFAAKFGVIKYIDFPLETEAAENKLTGLVRLYDAKAKELLEQHSGDLESLKYIATPSGSDAAGKQLECKFDLSLVSGAEEEEYWTANVYVPSQSDRHSGKRGASGGMQHGRNRKKTRTGN